MMTVNNVHHVAIGVADLDRARHFYAGVLGLEETPRPPFDFAGAWFRVGSQQIHLIVRPSSETPAQHGELDTRREHIALRVGSYRQTFDHLRALGIACVARPHNKTPWPQIYVADPDGNVIELNAEALD
jgi:catechol 2,3-dioxygenase-like lactoylglutathione lyase family enzyme